ncbi:hypothetical protein GUITHDRAFT_104646 [Guillardia theta CCMP2712]|uniref:Calmodulin n=1 Tax=Guillardia theta (strain CCMP2712) TaxID=905079 RepID=L1JMK1_GUITC|nr:hypothetical protein GUITHDRAFT_104646 [Guillardia theta CCMP2712]EKX49682.1 hypothetical protein GUITHDRAFT_104646 [Guillardia theta CCMP2712]|eukprot:XP_005836662.1 hypothetical protein GUITHDRAFT_104646 [Guillardia theta CCMP2712]
MEEEESNMGKVRVSRRRLMSDEDDKDSSNLVNKDFLSKSDPSCGDTTKVYTKNKKGIWKEIGRTERIKNNLNPRFKKKIEVDYVPSLSQQILFEIYDIDKDNVQELSKHDFLGRYETEIQWIVEKRVTQCKLMGEVEDLGSKDLGTITVTAEDAEQKFVLPPSQQWIKHDSVADWIPLHEIAFVKEVDDDSGAEDEVSFVIQTLPEGRNSGRSYVFSASTEEEVTSWCLTLQHAVREEQLKRKRAHELSEYGGNKFIWFRFKTLQLYESMMVQAIIAFSIIASFSIDCVQAELQPDESDNRFQILSTLNFVITLFFAFELAVNLFSRSSDFFRPFYSNMWNVFEVFIVCLSILSYVIYSKTLRYVSLFRTLRMFRVIRIFKGLHDLNRIMGALGAALIPLANAFMIQLLITCVYAVLATHLFGDIQPQFFGTFSASLFTMFQVLQSSNDRVTLTSLKIVTGDSWASSVTRTLFIDGKIDRLVAFFFISYVLIAGVLLDEFISTVRLEENRKRIQEEQERQAKAARINGVLDPLLSSMASFNDMNDFNAKVSDVYSRLDADKGGGLDFSELKNGL